jgi:hypothetical protein
MREGTRRNVTEVKDSSCLAGAPLQHRQPFRSGPHHRGRLHGAARMLSLSLSPYAQPRQARRWPPGNWGNSLIHPAPPRREPSSSSTAGIDCRPIPCRPLAGLQNADVRPRWPKVVRGGRRRAGRGWSEEDGDALADAADLVPLVHGVVVERHGQLRHLRPPVLPTRTHLHPAYSPCLSPRTPVVSAHIPSLFQPTHRPCLSPHTPVVSAHMPRLFQPTHYPIKASEPPCLHPRTPPPSARPA